MISLFKIASKCNIEMLSSVPKCKKATKCLMEKMYMFDGFHSGMRYSAEGHKFNINESKVSRKEETC